MQFQFSIVIFAASLATAIRPCIAVMRSRYVEVQRESGRLLANMCASDSEFTDNIIQGGGHQLLISYLLSQDTACQRVGALGIGNICTQDRHRVVLLASGTLEPLCSLARSEDIELEIQRFAVLGIANLASSVDNHPAFIEEGMLPLLISLSNAPDSEVRLYAAYALTKIAQNADVRAVVSSEGGLEPVLYLARTDEPEIQREILPALSTLSFADSNKIDICKNGGLPPIISAIRDASVETSRQACCALANLAEVVENMPKIIEANAVTPLVESLASMSPEVQRETARCIGNLAANIEYGDLILKAGSLLPLMAILRSDEHECSRMASMALCNIASNIKNQNKMLEGGILEPIVAQCRTALDPKARSDHETTRYCLLVLSNLSVSRQNHKLIMTEVLDVLAGFSKHRDIKCRQHAVFALGNLCANHDNLEPIIRTGCLKTFITYAFPSTDTSTNVQFQAIAALRGIATHQLLRMQCVREGALEVS